MIGRRTVGRVLMLMLMTALAAGCFSSTPGHKSSGDPTLKDALLELGPMMREYAVTANRAPTKAADLAPLNGNYPIAARALQAGDVLIVPGAPMGAEDSGREVIVAYEKKAPNEGGLVLFENGKVKELSAQQFASTAKGGS